MGNIGQKSIYENLFRNISFSGSVILAYPINIDHFIRLWDFRIHQCFIQAESKDYFTREISQQKKSSVDVRESFIILENL